MITQRGNEVNPEKVQALTTMWLPQNIHEVHKLKERIDALSRFIARSSDCAFSFFKILCKSSDFECSAESEQDFQEIKSYLAKLHILN